LTLGSHKTWHTVAFGCLFYWQRSFLAIVLSQYRLSDVAVLI
jgi:hypothetical protein